MYHPPKDEKKREALERQHASLVGELKRNNVKGVALKTMSKDMLNEALDELKNNTTLEAMSIFGSDFGPAEMERLAEILKTHPAITTLGIYTNKLGEEGAQHVAALLAANPRITELGIDSDAIGDVGAQALAAAIKENPDFKSLELIDCDISDDGGIPLAEALAGCEDLVRVRFKEVNQLEETAMALDETLFGKPNLIYCKPDGPEIFSCVEGNKAKIKALSSKIRDVPNLSLRDVYEISARLPSIAGLGNRQNDIAAFEEFLDGIPEVKLDDTLTPDDLFKRDKKGYAPLDNPKILNQLGEICDQLAKNGTPLTLERLDKEAKNGTYYLDILVKFAPLPKLVAGLNAGGQRIGAKELVEEEQPTFLLKGFLKRRGAAALFREENWQGGSKEELKAVLRVLPKEAREKIPNLHGLQADLSRNSGQERQR